MLLPMLLFASGVGHSSESPADDCRYRHVSVSVPVGTTSDGGEGHPWRAMFGYCLFRKGRWLLHQDWILSYLDAKPVNDAPGGNGVGAGTDFLLRWYVPGSRSLSTYLEVGNGVQYAAGTPFPAHGSRWQFTTNAGIGVLVPVDDKREWSAAIRYLHMSNGGLSDDNAGYDGVHLALRVKFGR